MPKVSLQKIMEGAISGVKKAWKDYYNFSGGDWLWAAPEYYLTSKIFDSLGKLVTVGLEYDVKGTLDDSGGKRPGRFPKSLNSKGKFDIVIWWDSGYPRGALEVKKLFNSYDEIKIDLEELVSMLNHARSDSTIQFGGCVIYTDAEDNAKQRSRDSVENGLNRVKELYREAAKENGFSFYCDDYIKEVEEEKSTWGVVCCLLVRKKKSEG